MHPSVALAIVDIMILPLRRDSLRERAALDERDELEQYERETPEQRLVTGLRLSEFARKLAKAASADWILEPADDLDEKAHLYAAPLRRLCRS
jgi:hypothetical protein